MSSANPAGSGPPLLRDQVRTGVARWLLARYSVGALSRSGGSPTSPASPMPNQDQPRVAAGLPDGCGGSRRLHPHDQPCVITTLPKNGRDLRNAVGLFRLGERECPVD